MDPISTVAGVASAIKAVSEMVTGFRKKKKADPETESLLSEIETRLFALQKEVLSLKEHEIRLLEENSQLRAKISSKEEGSLERQKYQRKKVGKATVMVRDDEPDTYYCPTCYANGKFIPIQVAPGGFAGVFGSHHCSTCNSFFPIG